MGKRWTWVAWSILAGFVAASVGAWALSVANDTFQDPAGTIADLLGFGAYVVVGALIVAHRPANAIGWIFSAISLLAITGALASEYATYTVVTRPGGLPGPVVAAWLADWTWYPTLGLALVFTLLLFPTGHLLSPRWRLAAWLAGALTAATAVLAALDPSLEVGEGHYVANPLGLSGVDNPEQTPLGSVLFGLLLVSFVVALVSLVLRFRRAQGDERQQLKWFTYGGTLLVVLPLSDYLPLAQASDLLFGLVIACLPVSAGIAILRHRLYDIDRLINRTLVYGLLTALLGGLYAGAVLLLGQLFGGLADQPPNWAVAGATLAVAALFQPARRRIQQAVDRRFNRRKYNTAKTIEAFSARLREQVDLDTLSTEVLAVVYQTMEPTRVSLWLRPSPDGSSDTPHKKARPTTWAY